MNVHEKEILKYVLGKYKDQWDRNQYARSNYDEDLEYYQGYRNANDYPLAYNVVYNRLLPIVYQLLARFMDQLYQSGNIVSVKPRKKVDIERAKKVEATLNFQLDSLNDIDMQGGSYLTMMKWMFNNITFGKGIVKAYWRKEERISPKRLAIPVPNFDRMGNFQGMDVIDYVNQEMQTLYDGPYVEVLHNKTFVPHPEYKSIQLMPAVFLVYKKSIDYIKKMADKGVYIARNIKELGIDSSGGAGVRAKDSEESFAKSIGIEGALSKTDLSDERKSPDVDILECYAKLIFDNAPYEVGSGIKIKGYEEEAIIHVGNYNTILSIQKNTYGVRPLFDMGCYLQPELYWDLGIIRLAKGIQEQVNTMANLRTQNAMMMVNQMMKVRVDSDIDPKALRWKPFGLIPVEQMDDVEPLIIPDMHSNLFMEQENFYEHSIQDLTGMYCLLTEDKDTDYEILTDEGWKRFDKLNRQEKVMTLNYDTDEMEWQKPTDYIEYQEDIQDCYHFKNQSAEFICSPEHRIPLYSKGKKKVLPIKDIPKGHYGNYSIPAVGFQWKGNDDWSPEWDISHEDWAAFIGIYLAEGHVSLLNGGHQIGIAQEGKQENVDKIDHLLKGLPFNFKYNGHQWTTYNKSLYEYLKPFGKSHEKYVPPEIKNSSIKILQIFLEWYLMGDGSVVRGEDRFSTVSEQLADDIQEIVFKLGKKANIRKDNNSQKGHAYHDRWAGEIVDNHKYVGLQGNKSSQQVIQRKQYKGRMTCLTVPNGIFLIRKNKKPIWTGNSYNMGQTPNRQERVGVVHSIQSMGEARAKLMLMSMDYLGIRPLLKYMMILNTFHLPSGFEYRISDQQGQDFGMLFGDDIHPDFDFAARYTAMEPALGKQFRSQQLIQMAQMWMQSPWINQYQMSKVIMELLDIREADLLLKSPQQFMQEIQQQQQAAMMAKQQEVQAETKGKLLTSGQDFREELALNQQEFGYDMALEAIKQEAVSEK